jgi:signal transduction histidine kinase
MERLRFGATSTEPAIILTRRPAVQAYGVAVALVLLACAVTLLLHIWFSPAPVTPFLAAVAFAAWYGGIGPALLAVVLSLVPVGVALEPYGDWALSDSDRASLALFVLVSALLLLLSVSRDRAEVALRAGEQRLAAILDQLPLGVSVVDRKGQLDLHNPPMRRLAPEAMASLHPERLRHSRVRAPDGAPLVAADWPPSRALRGEPVVGNVEFLVTDDQGREAWVAMTAAPLRDAGGTVMGAIVVVQDIDERKRAEAERTAFLDALAHDVKNPLAAAKLQTQLLRRRLRQGATDPERLEPGLGVIEEAADRATALIDELLDAARLREGRSLELRTAPTDVVALAAACVEEAQRTTTGHQLRVMAEVPVLVGEWDGDRLARVLGNLLKNAVTYSPHGGEIVVRVRCEEYEGHAWAIVAVTDHGIGVPEADVPRLFERFYRGGNVTGRIAGAGIGLAGARQIVEQHGGTIAVTSVEGAGTTFTIRLPIAAPAKE